MFKAILRAPDWNTALLQAFRHFLVNHVGFDSDPGQGHGLLIRHIAPDHRVRAVWQEFRKLLITAVPRLLAEVALRRGCLPSIEPYAAPHRRTASGAARDG